MPALRRSKYLTCFYCGRRTSTLNDGRVSHFECPNCEATNYLDEHGEITDPPVQATSARPEEPGRAPSTRAARLRPEESSSAVFCDTCLTNQRLFTASLAQYLPDDPDDPEYEERERNYYVFRNGLEKRYPQVCAACEPKVLQRITQAGYTAKTDHLRRMIDRSKEARAVKSTGMLDLVAGLGRCLWTGGFVLQALWHLSILLPLLGRGSDVEGQGPFWGSRYLLALTVALHAVLPSPERLMKWSIVSTVSSLWWNPYFAKTFRGFTKHILGLPAWYTYQAAIMFIRIVSLGIPSMSPLEASEPSTEVAAHAFIMIFLILVYTLALASVRTDTTPLFAPTPKGNGAALVRSHDSAPKPCEVRGSSMADILDEVLASSTQPQVTEACRGQYLDETPSRSNFSPSLRERPTARLPLSSGFDRPNPSFSMASLDISEVGLEQIPSTQQHNVQYDTEMDWTPTQSKHRAFSSFGDTQQQPLRGFGQVPVADEPRQFWYKVPPAPASIARRALNPPERARLRKQPSEMPTTEMTQGPLFGSTANGAARLGKGEASGRANDVAFREASFFHEEGNDPRNTLSDMFGRALTVSPGREGGGASDRSQGEQAGGGGRRRASPNPAPRHVDLSDVALLAVSCLLFLVKSLAFVPEEYAAHRAMAVCGLSVIIWARTIIYGGAGPASVSRGRNARRRGPKAWVATVVGTVLFALEITLVIRIGIYAWAEGRLEACLDMGNWFIGTLVTHQLWNLLSVHLV